MPEHPRGYSIQINGDIISEYFLHSQKNSPQK